MKQECKIAELGMLDMLYQMKNPLTNIKLCLDVFEKAAENIDSKVYYGIIEKSIKDIENTIKELCASFNELGLA